jgi:hypothetical protein
VVRYNIYKDHVRLDDYEIHDGMGLELYYKWAEVERATIDSVVYYSMHCQDGLEDDDDECGSFVAHCWKASISFLHRFSSCYGQKRSRETWAEGWKLAGGRTSREGWRCGLLTLFRSKHVWIAQASGWHTETEEQANEWGEIRRLDDEVNAADEWRRVTWVCGDAAVGWPSFRSFSNFVVEGRYAELMMTSTLQARACEHAAEVTDARVGWEGAELVSTMQWMAECLWSYRVHTLHIATHSESMPSTRDERRTCLGLPAPRRLDRYPHSNQSM